MQSPPRGQNDADDQAGDIDQKMDEYWHGWPVTFAGRRRYWRLCWSSS